MIQNALGSVIRSFRKERMLSQDVLSGLAGIARSHLSDIENGKKQPNLDTLCKIAEALEVPAYVILQNAEGPKQNMHTTYEG